MNVKSRGQPASNSLLLAVHAAIVCLGCAGVLAVGFETKSVEFQLVPPEAAPQHGTFWSWQKQGGEPPLPFNPFPLLPLYVIGTNTYTYDDSTVDYVTLREDVAAHWTLTKWELKFGLETPVVPELGLYGDPNGGMQMMESEGPPSPPGAGGSGTNGPGGSLPEPYNYPAHTLWLEITTVTNALAHLIVHGTVPSAAYEILSREVLTNVPWASEGTLAGAAAQDWTPTTVAVGTRTNALFFWARLGLPEAWQWQWFGQLGVAADGDPDGDGLSNLEEYLWGANPMNAPAFAAWVASPQRFSGLP